MELFLKYVPPCRSAQTRHRSFCWNQNPASKSEKQQRQQQQQKTNKQQITNEPRYRGLCYNNKYNSRPIGFIAPSFLPPPHPHQRTYLGVLLVVIEVGPIGVCLHELELTQLSQAQRHDLQGNLTTTATTTITNNNNTKLLQTFLPPHYHNKLSSQ